MSDAHAATFEVTTLADSGAGSLREAITNANNAAGADVITFQSGLSGTITLTTGALNITDEIDIQGPGSDVLTLSGNNTDRLFTIGDASRMAVGMSGLNITGGNPSSGVGGAIEAKNSVLTLDSMRLTDNTAPALGGAIHSDFMGTLIVRDSVIAQNSVTAGGGGGLYVRGELILQDSVVSSNEASVGAGLFLADADGVIERSTILNNTAAGRGGGIMLREPVVPFVIRDSTISGNVAPTAGGLDVYLYDGSARIENTTISGNQATANQGGGVYVDFFNGGGSPEFFVRSCTIAGNSAAASSGGGIYLVNNGAGTTLTDTILADNTAASNPDIATSGASAVASYSLIETVGTASVTLNNSITGQDPQLAALDRNGGPTETRMIAATSPAVNAGTPGTSDLPSDQRGLSRVAGDRIDIGAVERNTGTVQLSAATFSAAEADGTVNVVVSRAGGAEGAVSVSYSTMNGSAMSPGDYTAATGMLEWTDGDVTNKSIPITLSADSEAESDETFTVELATPVNAALGTQSTATVTITDSTPATTPTIPPIADATIDEDAVDVPLSFTIGDSDTPLADLIVTAVSSNQTLLPDASIELGGTGASRTVTITPAANQNGTANITITVSDGTDTATDTFQVTVTAIYDAATIAPVADQVLNVDQATSALAVTLTDPDGMLGSFILTAASSNQTLVPNANIVLGGAGLSRTVTVTPASGEVGTADITLSLNDGTGAITETFQVTVSATPINTAPTVSAIDNQTISQGAATGDLAFTVGDAETAVGSLTVSASSSNQTLVPDANITLGGSDANRTVKVTPVASQTGTADITVSVSDGTNTVTEVFTLTVNAVPNTGAPTITAVDDQTISAGAATSELAFTIGDPDVAADSLTVSASSSNDSLIPNANIQLGGSGASRTVKVTPLANQVGTADITISVSDGTNTSTEAFKVTVNAVSPGNGSPTISAIADQTIDEDSSTDTISFAIGDPDTAVGDLTLRASSSNQIIVRNTDIVFGGSGEQRTVKITPRPDRYGAVNITIIVSDGTNSAMESFRLTINSVEDPGPTTPDAGTEEPSPEDAGTDGGLEPSSDDDCSCRVVGQKKDPSGSFVSTLLAVAGFAAWRKRRRDKRGARN